jgi:hypothetical protein
MGIRCADHVTPLYPQKLALSSPTGSGRSVGIVRSRTKATEFSLVYIYRSLYVSGDYEPIIRRNNRMDDCLVCIPGSNPHRIASSKCRIN